MASNESESAFDSPLVVFKVGVLGSAPLDMPAKLADEYGAQVFSSDSVRKEIIESRDASGVEAGIAQLVRLSDIRTRISRDAKPVLEEGDDVVLDMFFNNPNTRRFPLGLANDVGAMTIALWVNVERQVALDRVHQWTEEGAFEVPVSRWGIQPEQAARRMMNQIEGPSTIEGIDYVFNIDGTGGTESILDQFSDHIWCNGLDARFEQVE